MNFFIWTAIVGIVGWGGSLAMKDTIPHHHVLHALLGVSGALLGAFLMTMPAGVSMGESRSITILSSMVSFFIALALSMIANLWDRVSAQDNAEMDF